MRSLLSLHRMWRPERIPAVRRDFENASPSADFPKAFLTTHLVKPRLFPFPMGIAGPDKPNSMYWESGLQPQVVCPLTQSCRDGADIRL